MLLRIPDFPVHYRGLLWDSSSQMANVFLVWTDSQTDIFVYQAERLTGEKVQNLQFQQPITDFIKYKCNQTQ